MTRAGLFMAQNRIYIAFLLRIYDFLSGDKSMLAEL